MTNLLSHTTAAAVPTRSPRNAWLPAYVATRGLDGLVTWTVAAAVPLAVLATTHSAAWTGSALAAEWIPRLACFALAGTLSDRLGARRLMAAVTFGRGLLAAGLGFLAAATHDTTLTAIALVTLGITMGVLGEAGFVAAEGLAADAHEHVRLPHARVQSLLVTCDQTTVLLGPLFAAGLVAAGTHALYAAPAALSLLAAITSLRLPIQAPTKEDTSSIAALLAGARTVWQSPSLRWLTATTAALNWLSGLALVGTPIILGQRLSASPSTIGLAWTIAAVGGLASSLAAGPLITRIGLRPAGLTAIVLGPLAVAGAALAPTIALYITALTLLSIAEGVGITWLRTIRRPLLPDQGYATTLAVTAVAGLVPLPFAGIAMAATGTPDAPALLTVGAALGAGALVGGWRRLRTALTPYTD